MIKKLLIAFLILFIAALFTLTFFARKAPEILKNSLEKALNRKISIRSVEYHFPWEFELQGLSFKGVEECSPCHWMDRAFASGAEKALKGRGGLRAKIMSDGVLKRTP